MLDMTLICHPSKSLYGILTIRHLITHPIRMNYLKQLTYKLPKIDRLFINKVLFNKFKASAMKILPNHIDKITRTKLNTSQKLC